eukprot:350713-Chlamydomonas_euryale.AAC.7
MARDLTPDIERLMESSNPYLRKKAALCATRWALARLCGGHTHRGTGWGGGKGKGRGGRWERQGHFQAGKAGAAGKLSGCLAAGSSQGRVACAPPGSPVDAWRRVEGKGERRVRCREAQWMPGSRLEGRERGVCAAGKLSGCLAAGSSQGRV